MWIGNDVAGRFHEKFEVLCRLEQKIEDDIMTSFEVLSLLEQILK
jgi:hypothetical protein